ncbi:MAG TPA: hypothetical protein VMB71_01815, partial [Acetobacteraceae bacterium]|nr:hypothetical protein [Acetobacteraceae bacterium]
MRAGSFAVLKRLKDIFIRQSRTDIKLRGSYQAKRPFRSNLPPLAELAMAYVQGSLEQAVTF